MLLIKSFYDDGRYHLHVFYVKARLLLSIVFV